MSYPRINAALAHCERVRDLIIQHGGGWADTDALRKFQQLSYAASRTADDAECGRLMRAADRYAMDLFSGSAHEHWATGHMSGADFLRLRILWELDAFRERLMHLQLAAQGQGEQDRTDDFPGGA